ncbi:MAG: hypothetical protein HQL56_09990 [Magnetococcales bacterium]|nr:hypothetical protein [Magnetococcales bacterium]
MTDREELEQLVRKTLAEQAAKDQERKRIEERQDAYLRGHALAWDRKQGRLPDEKGDPSLEGTVWAGLNHANDPVPDEPAGDQGVSSPRRGADSRTETAPPPSQGESEPSRDVPFGGSGILGKALESFLDYGASAEETSSGSSASEGKTTIPDDPEALWYPQPEPQDSTLEAPTWNSVLRGTGAGVWDESNPYEATVRPPKPEQRAAHDKAVSEGTAKKGERNIGAEFNLRNLNRPGDQTVLRIESWDNHTKVPHLNAGNFPESFKWLEEKLDHLKVSKMPSTDILKLLTKIPSVPGYFGVAQDVVDLDKALHSDAKRSDGQYPETAQTAGRIGGGWAGALGGARVGGRIGGIFGLPGMGAGTLLGGVLGGIGVGGLGESVGATFGKGIFNPSKDDEESF